MDTITISLDTETIDVVIAALKEKIKSADSLESIKNYTEALSEIESQIS